MSHSVMLAEQGELNFSTAQRVRHLKAEEQDFEWYPSSEHIIDVVRRDLVESKFLESYNRESSLLDIGAGDDRDLIVTVEGFKDKTAFKIMAGMASHAELFEKISTIIKFQQKVAVGKRFAGQKVVITGFRDGALEKMIEAEGVKCRPACQQKQLSSSQPAFPAATANSKSARFEQ